MAPQALRLVSSALVLAVPAVWAQSQDIVTMRAGVNVTNYDNFFSSPSANAVSDRATTQNIGTHVSLPYGLQRFELDANLAGTQYQNNSSFDYTGQNYSAGWQWSLTPRLHGALTSTRADSLNAATDSVNPGLRNKNTSKNTGLSVAYDLAGPWQLTAGGNDSSSANEQALVGQSDNHSVSVNSGVRYQTGAGNSVAYSLEEGRGTSTSDYTSVTNNVTATWLLTGKTTLNGRVARMNQHFAATPQFDFGGWSGSLNLDWRMTGKTSLGLGWARDLASYQTAGSAYTQTDSLSIAPAWNITAKSSLRLQYRYSVRADQGNPTGVASDRVDNLQDTSLSYSWQPRTSTTLSATLSQSSRSSNVANADYTAHQFMLAAQFGF